MPEGDTIFRAARTLNRALQGQTVRRFESVFPKLNNVNDALPIPGRTVEAIESAGKWLLMRFSGDLILLTHMLMNGSWHIYRVGERWQRRADDMRVLVETDTFQAVAFSIQVAELHTAESLKRREGFRQLGQDLLGEKFDETAAVAALRSRPELEIGEALLRQSLIAGIGNVYKSEVCFACGVLPLAPVSRLSDSQLLCLVREARKFLALNVAETAPAGIVTYLGARRTTGHSNPGERLWVYGRAGQPCRKCATPIERTRQGVGARVTFWCPRCQAL